MRRLVIFLCLCLFLILPRVSNGRNQSKFPSMNLDYFYIVFKNMSDVAPFRVTYIIDIQAAEGGTTIRNIQITPPDLPCSSITIKAVETKLRGVTPAQLVPQINPCSLSPLEVLQNTKRQKTRALGQFDPSMPALRFDISPWGRWWESFTFSMS